VGAVIYLQAVAESSQVRRSGAVFNEVADDYDRHRPAYPEGLVDLACEAARLEPGARVLEIGCGTGQLTRSLLARGLRVTAVEPGEQLIIRARDQLAGSGDVHWVNSSFEEASVLRARYGAVFSASAIHWVDPDLGWRKIADALVDGGTLALVSYFGMEDSRSASDQRALRATLAGIAPRLAAEWPSYRDLKATLEGAAHRRANVSEVWAWLGSYDVARGHVVDLFEHAELSTLPMLVEHSADSLNAMLGTMSFWARLKPEQRDRLCAQNRALQERLGRPIRSTIVACLVTARRRSRV